MLVKVGEWQMSRASCMPLLALASPGTFRLSTQSNNQIINAWLGRQPGGPYFCTVTQVPSVDHDESPINY